MRHADDARLHAYLDGELRWLGEDPAGFESHLEGCAACRARLAEARQLREHARSLLGRQLPVERPPFEAVLERARGGNAPVMHRRRVPTAVWAASVMLALAGGWLARDLVRRGDVAVSSPSAPAARADSVPRTPSLRVAAIEPAPPSGPLVETREPPHGAAPQGPVDVVARPSGALAADPAAPTAPVEVAAAPRSAEPEPEAMPLSPTRRRLEADPLAARVPAVRNEGGRIRMIEGRVTDESGRVIRGAAVQVRGLGVGTLTGADGTYSLAMPEDGAGKDEEGLVITAAALGWESAAKPLSPASDRALTRDFRLRPATVALEAIVAVGYGADTRAPRDADTRGEGVGSGWGPAERQEISRLLGRDALHIAGLPVLETAIGFVDGVRTVRVRQELPGGAVATLLQWAEPRPGSAVAAAAAIPRLRPSRRPLDGVEAEATAWRTGVRIVARAPLPADSLTGLLEGLR